MLKISKAISSKQAKKYYQNELQNDLDVSLAKESPASYQGEWHGRLAEEMGLKGEVQAEQFERLCDGLHPFTEEEMVRHVPAKTYTNKFGKEITSMEHRALIDATFSAPKSVSLAAIAGGDDRIREAHRESVHKALDELERYTEARMGGKNLSERTGKMASALFDHDLARPDKTFKFAAPQLHTHAVVFNVTETESGLTKPIQPLELYKTQTYATAVYRIELADRLQKLGYEIEIDPKTRAPEIKGFSEEYLKESSLRSQEIQKEAEAIKNKFELEGVEVKNDVGIRQIAAWQQRESKGFDLEEMKTRALELEVNYDFQAQRIVGQALQNGFQYDAAAVQQNALSAVDYAKEIASSQTALQNDLAQASLSAPDALAKLNERQFLTEALKTGIGSTNFAAVQQEYNSRNTAGEFSNLIKNDYEKSSSRALDQERGKSNEEPRKIEQSAKELKSSKEMDSLSMDALEKEIKQKVIVEKKVAQSLELLIGF
jgi:conjugative relaxase-like TrwC/TraI family protein